MATKARLHWFWRVMTGVLIGVVVNGLATWLVMPLFSYVPVHVELWSRTILALTPWLGSAGAALATCMIYFGTSTAIASVGTYSLLTRLGSRQFDQDLHCRRCAHILRGLSEPRCPECGEPI